MAYDLQKLDAMMQAFIAEKKLPGVSVAVRGPEGVIFEKGYGIADLEGRKVDEHTMYGIASMS
ncbi:MAG: serine hydrolase, partial [Clostridia bacterium]|nr:serine hydrolase [Clostridia bacterium]